MPPQPSIWSLCLELISPSICSEVMHFLNSFFSFFTPQFRTPPWHSTISSSGPFTVYSSSPTYWTLNPKIHIQIYFTPRKQASLLALVYPNPSHLRFSCLPSNIPLLTSTTFPSMFLQSLCHPDFKAQFKVTIFKELFCHPSPHHCSFQGFAELCWGAEPTSLPLIVLLHIHLLVYSIKIYWAIFMCKILC